MRILDSFPVLFPFMTLSAILEHRFTGKMILIKIYFQLVEKCQKKWEGTIKMLYLNIKQSNNTFR